MNALPPQAAPDVPGTAPAPRYVAIPQSRPIWTYVLLAINVLLWVVPAVPYLLSGDARLLNLIYGLGIKDDAAIAQGEYWRLLTSTFLHDPNGILHIGSNMLFLYVIGPQLEAPLGRWRFLVVYFLSGLMGSAMSYLLSASQSLGASGALFGLLGALVVYVYRNRRGFGEFGRRRLNNLLGVIFINVIISIGVPSIDLWGHAGGLLAGLLLGWGLSPRYGVERDLPWGNPRVTDQSSPLLRALITMGVIFLFLFLVALGTLRWTSNPIVQ